MLDRFFSYTRSGSTLKTEVLAGLTTFLTMAYIIVVNPSVLGETGMDKQSLVIVTCLVSGFSTLLMGLIPRVPIAMAPGMGLNAFFAYTIVLSEGVAWQTALGMVFWAGVLFLILSLWGTREKIIEVIPPSLVSGISVGIGLFILFIGMKNMGLVIDHPAKLVTLGPFDTNVLIGLAGLFLTIALYLRQNKAAIFLGIAFSTVLAGLGGQIVLPGSYLSFDMDISPIAFQLDFSGSLKWSLLPTVFVLFYVDMFDTIGTLLACTKEAGLERPDGKVRGMRKMMGVDAFATMMSGLMGTSPTTSYIESGAGIIAGGKTGLTSVTTGLLFLLCIVFAPVLMIVPVYATAPALIMVGILMVRQVNRIDFTDLEEAIPAILTFVLMPLTFSISTGLACGFISWGLIKILLGKAHKIHWLLYIVILLSFGGLLL